MRGPTETTRRSELEVGEQRTVVARAPGELGLAAGQLAELGQVFGRRVEHARNTSGNKHTWLTDFRLILDDENFS